MANDRDPAQRHEHDAPREDHADGARDADHGHRHDHGECGGHDHGHDHGAAAEAPHAPHGHDHDHGECGGHDHGHDHGERGDQSHGHAHSHSARSGHDHVHDGCDGHDHGRGHAHGDPSDGGENHGDHDHAGHDHAGHSHGGHDHGHGHSHFHGDPADLGAAFPIAMALNIAFIIVEVVFGTIAGSVALLADAAHNLSDVLGLGLAWGAASLARRAPTRRHTYGLRKSTVLAALTNAVLILVAIGGVAWEAIERLFEPSAVESTTVIWVAAAGLLVNGGSAALFLKGHKHDANIRGAFLHLAADAAVSLGVVVAGVAMTFTDWHWLDPATSLLVSALILGSTWSLLKNALNLALDAVPDHIDPEAVSAWLAGHQGVLEVHDLHIWPMSTTEVALTAHLVTPHPAPAGLVPGICKGLKERFEIHHSTIQLESPDDAPGCHQAPDDAL